LTAKEADWKDSLRTLYVFNSAACLFTQSFTSGLKTNNLLSDDLITGGFSGILSLLSEITNEEKQLRIIDKEGVKIYFAYGKYVIVALVSTKSLPILSKKLELFSKAFEKMHEHDLIYFKGKITSFKDASELITKYFK